MMKRAFVVAALGVCFFLTLSFAQARRSDYIWASGSTTVTPGTPFTVDFRTNDGDNRLIKVRVYRVSIDDAVNIVRRNQHADASAARGTLVWEGSAHGKSDGWDGRRISVGPFPIGLYVVQGSIGSASDAVLANVTTLGLVSIAGAGRSALWAVDLRTFRHHAGPTEVLLYAKHSVQRVRCDLDGIAMVGNALPNDTVYVAQTADGSADVQNIWNYYADNSRAPSAQFVQTDRPVYRPGQRVYFRAILRSGYENAYGIPSGEHRVEIDDPQGTPVFTKSVALSSFGTLSGDAVLPSSTLGGYSLQIDGNYAASFYVEAYKKPEYLIDAKAREEAVVGGDTARIDVHTAYVFGRPAAGMNVHYAAYTGWYQPYEFNPYSDYFTRERSQAPPGNTGDASTDAKGQAILRTTTQREKWPYALNFRITARDASGRTIEADRSVMVYPAGVRVSIMPQNWFAQTGHDAPFDVLSTDLHDRPAPGARVHLTFVRSVWDRRTSHDDDTVAATRDVLTDAQGRATVHWTATEGGSYRITAQTADSRGNVDSDEQYLWVIGNDDEWLPPLEQPVLIPLRQTLSANERPRVLVRMPAPGRDVVLTVSTDHLVSARVVHVTGYAASIGFDAPPNARVFQVHALLPTEEGISDAQVQFTRKPAAKALHVTVRSLRSKYEPGMPATFDVLVTDVHGKPVRTELSLGVVDDSIYAVQASDDRDPLDAFYGKMTWVNAQAEWYRPNYVPPPSASEQGVPTGTAVPMLKTIAHVASRGPGDLVKPGTTSDVYSVNAATTMKVRTNFQDTAYWTPAVVTDAHGHARITFTWPDNLTTWRTTALGVTSDTDVGEGRAETLVTKDFLVRLEMPRFLRKGDRTTVVGIAQGQPDSTRVTLSLAPDAIDPLTKLLRLDANQSAAAAWPFEAGSVLGDRSLTLSGSDGLRSDAMRLDLPVESAGAAEHIRDANSIDRANSVTLALPPGYDAGTLRVTLTPSIAAQLLQNVRMLDVYPYYCTEQTMSAALPAVFLDRLFRGLGLQMPQDVSPPQVIAHAIDRLQELQHSDGSWGWWENDAAHPFMTAYALYGLAEMKKAGYTVPDAMFRNGLASLEAQLQSADADTLRFWGGAQPNSEWNTRAFMLFSLADADPQHVDRRMLQETLRHERMLNPYALAVLGLAYHELRDDVTATQILAVLNAQAKTNGPYTFWSGETWHYAWEDDPIETTAYALRLNAALKPNSEVTARAVAFLRSQQHGSWWYTTKDTAASVYAIAEAERPSAQELHPDETVSVAVDGRVVKALHVTTAVLNASDAQIDVPVQLLHDGSMIRVSRSGRGALYWATDFTRYAPWSVHAVRDSSRPLFARLFPPRPPLKIQRQYSVNHRGDWHVGDEVHVDVTVRANENVQYVAIEDPFPAAAEYAPLQGEAGSGNWSGVQFFDDRAVFFADRLYGGQVLHLSYDLRVTNDGAYAAPPPVAYAMYGPPISATGSGEHVTVADPGV
ncbi:MAG TPA: alpha-2-macroglobulin family protein [Candidatus Baltobacteraceae bacterium]|nr:alpha-2-macroglobulin family protein [Candidatus Baltobacteraceae bacterium]